MFLIRATVSRKNDDFEQNVTRYAYDDEIAHENWFKYNAKLFETKALANNFLVKYEKEMNKLYIVHNIEIIEV